ncbi:MAG: hypothetical protein ACQESZ_10085 [Bacteroidota bacterium]
MIVDLLEYRMALAEKLLLIVLHLNKQQKGEKDKKNQNKNDKVFVYPQ